VRTFVTALLKSGEKGQRRKGAEGRVGGLLFPFSPFPLFISFNVLTFNVSTFKRYKLLYSVDSTRRM